MLLKDIEDKISDITKLATNTTFNAKINGVKNDRPSITNLAATAALNAKINEVKSEISNITNLATTAGFTNVGNKIPDHNKYITLLEFNKSTAEYVAGRLAKANYIDNLVKKDRF